MSLVLLAATPASGADAGGAVAPVYSVTWDATFTPTGAAAPNGKWLAVSQQGQLTLTDLTSKVDRPVLGGATDRYAVVVFLGSDKLVTLRTTSGKDLPAFAGTVILSVPDLKVMAQHPGRFVLTVAPDDSTCLASVVDDDPNKWPPVYELWALDTGKSLRKLEVGKGLQVDHASFRGDGKQFLLDLAPAGADAGIAKPKAVLFETATGKRLAETEIKGFSALSPNGKKAVVATGWARKDALRGRDACRFWDVEEGQLIDGVGLLIPQQGVILGARYTADGGNIVVVGSFGAALLDATSEKLSEPVGNPKLLVGELKVHYASGRDVMYVTATSRAGVQVWRVSVPAKKP